MNPHLKESLLKKAQKINAPEANEFCDGNGRFYLAISLRNPIESLYKSYASKKIKDPRIKAITEKFIYYLGNELSEKASRDRLVVIGVCLLIVIGLDAMVLVKMIANNRAHSLLFSIAVVVELMMMGFFVYVAKLWYQKNLIRISIMRNCVSSFNQEAATNGVELNFIPKNGKVFIEVADMKQVVPIISGAQNLFVINEESQEFYRSKESHQLNISIKESFALN